MKDKDNLSPSQKAELAKAIFNNPKARATALTGALLSGNYALATKLI